MERLKFMSSLPEKGIRMHRCSFDKHDCVPGPEKGHRKQPFTQYHDQTPQDPITGRLHIPGQNQRSQTGQPAKKTERWEEVVFISGVYNRAL
jgi:hypothetical protein